MTEYENGRVYFGPVAEMLRKFLEAPVKRKRELPVFGLPGIWYRTRDGRERYRWSMEFKEPSQ